MTQRTVGSPTIADKEVRKSRGHWHRESHARHRDYSPTLGRFIERDPIGFEAGDGNWYRFVANGPAGNVDPSGLWAWDDDWIQMGFGGLFGGYGAGVAYDAWSAIPNVAVHADIHSRAAAARERAWRGYADSTNPIDAGANLLFGVGLNAVGEGFAHGGLGIAEVVSVGGLRGRRTAGKCALSKVGSEIRNDIALSGGRSGQNVKNLTGPPNSAVRGADGRIYVTNGNGQVIFDITRDRVKPVTPGQGFGPKRPPTPDELELINKIYGRGAQ